MAAVKEGIRSVSDLMASVGVPRSIDVHCGRMRKGIDNYHVDVRINEKFILLARTVIAEMVKRTVAGRKPQGHQDDMDALGDIYEDLLRTLVHRSKTDLVAGQIHILQFAMIKFVLLEVRTQLDTSIKEIEEMLAQQQYSGSRNLLTTQERLAWMRTRYSMLHYQVARAILKLLQREENNKLRQLRAQFLGRDFSEGVHIMFNPMLAAISPLDPYLLMDSYSLWPGDPSEFAARMSDVEDVLRKRLPNLPVRSLREHDRLMSAQNEVYDELGGLFAVQALLGPSEDQKDQISESFCWFDHPGNLRMLFDSAIHERTLNGKSLGMRAQWQLRSEFGRLEKLAAELRKKVLRDDEFTMAVAGHHLRDVWRPIDEDLVDLRDACALAGGLEVKRLASRIEEPDDRFELLLSRFSELASGVEQQVKQEADAVGLRLLSDLCRYRMHLKYYRFAHRLFNRLNIITDREQAALSRAGDHLYELQTTEEMRKDDAPSEIVHHTILKADVRGSTTVTQELIKQGLNPASYFSTRFFDPITDVLKVYGATKVFIEGDAVILGIYEHDDAPDQWYAVARACGLAVEMLDIVNAKNRHSMQVGLPKLEIGIGICFEDEKPLFLFDEGRPIMISSAIGDADRMSGCSWKLRAVYKPDPFNVGVFDIVDGEGEKGQDVLRYNVNGVLLDKDAFKKLKSEIVLKRHGVKMGESQAIMFVGKYPDVAGKERDLVIREGRIGQWHDEGAYPAGEDADVFYEVLPRSRVSNQVLEIARKSS